MLEAIIKSKELSILCLLKITQIEKANNMLDTFEEKLDNGEVNILDIGENMQIALEHRRFIKTLK